MFDFHLLKNGFSEEGIFLMLIRVENTICDVSITASFFVQTDTNTPISTSLQLLLTSVQEGGHRGKSKWFLRRDKRVMVPLLPLLQKNAF